MYRPSQTPRLAMSSDRITPGIFGLPFNREPRRRSPPDAGRSWRRATTADAGRRGIGRPLTRLVRELP